MSRFRVYRRNLLRLVGAGLLIIAIVGLLLWIFWYVQPQTAQERKDLLQTVGAVTGGVALLIGLYFTRRTLQVNEQGQVTERFTRAVEQLGSPSTDVRLGGIYALERIATDSDRDRWTVLEILTAYLRAHKPWFQNMPSASPQEGNRGHPATIPHATSLGEFADTQAILTILSRRPWDPGADRPHQLNLSQTDLRYGNFGEAHLEGIDFRSSRLDKAGLIGCRLGPLGDHRSQLGQASLQDTHLERAELMHAHLDGADLRGARLLGADLSSADLRRSDLCGASLTGVIMKGAELAGADLRGTDLQQVVGLTQEQIDQTYMDARTELPNPDNTRGQALVRSTRKKLDEWSAWSLTGNWRVIDDALVHEGQDPYSETRWLPAPYPPETADYEISARIRVDEQLVECPKLWNRCPVNKRG